MCPGEIQKRGEWQITQFSGGDGDNTEECWTDSKRNFPTVQQSECFQIQLSLTPKNSHQKTQNQFDKSKILKLSILHKHTFHWWVLLSFTENSLLALLCCGRLTDKCTSELWGSLCQVSISCMASLISKGKRLRSGVKMQDFFLKMPCAYKPYLKHTHFICILCMNAPRQTEKTIPKPA